MNPCEVYYYQAYTRIRLMSGQDIDEIPTDLGTFRCIKEFRSRHYARIVHYTDCAYGLLS